MRTYLTVLGAMIISSTAPAATLECGVTVMTAGSGGLVPSMKTITLKETLLQNAGSLDLKKCSHTKISDLNIVACGLEDSEAVGVYRAELNISDKLTATNDAFDSTTATDLLATPKKGTQLVSLVATSALSPVFIKKMTAASIEIPNYQGGDSLEIDDAIAAAMKKGVLTTQDIVAIAIDHCRLK